MNRIVVASGILLTFMAGSGCKKECTAKGQDNCICYEIYAPVCGCDGKTYANDCHAACAKVEYTEGACK